MIPDHIFPALDEGMSLLPFRMDSAKARVQLLAIGLQESKFHYRRQMISMLVNGEKVLRPTGPAKGYHQFEEGGGCRGVVKHEAARNWTQSVCQARGVHFSPKAVWDAMERDDAFDFAMARLLLWTDVRPLPALGETDTAWAYYMRVWRPGAWTRGDAETRAELRAKWGRNYNAALVALQ